MNRKTKKQAPRPPEKGSSYYLRPSTLAAIVADLWEETGAPPSSLREECWEMLCSHVGEKEALALVKKEDTYEKNN
jgi:hypothetical protein